MPPDKSPRVRNVLPDLVVPVAAIAFSIYYLSTITEVPWTSQASAVFVSALLFAAIAAYAWRTWRRVRQGRETLRLAMPAIHLPTELRRLLLLGLTVAYILLLEPMGFTLTTFLFLFCAILLLSSPGNWKSALKVALACSVAGYLIFIQLFQTRFPEGFIERAIEGLLNRGA